MNLKALIWPLVALSLAGSAVLAETAPGEVVWVDDISIPASLTGVAGNTDEGIRVMTTPALGNCVACHEVGALSHVPFHGNIGPSLDGVGSRWSEAELRGILVDAKHVFPESRMPSFYRTEGFIRPGDRFTGRAADPATFGPLLSAQQIEDTVAYLVTLTD